MSEINENKLAQLFCQEVQQHDDKVNTNDSVEKAVAYTNRQTGIRDVIELFVASIFTLLLGWLGTLNVKTQEKILQMSETSKINEHKNKS